MRNKKVAAIVLAATMVIGSTFTAFAADSTASNASPSNASGSTTGAGTNEAHVDKEVINVVLPTVPEGSTPFAYTTDPERLIQATAGSNAKYEDYTLPAKDKDSGVYFRVGAKELANESETLQVINKSSANVTVTVAIDTTKAATDLGLAGDASPSDANPLSLNLKVGNTNTAITGNGQQQVTKTIAGIPDNFEVTYADGKYGYTEKADASGWKALDISMNGSVKETAAKADTTAPTIKVTWSYAKAADSATPDAGDQTDALPTVTLSKDGVITITGLTKDKAYESILVGASDKLTDSEWDTSNFNDEDGTGEIIIKLGQPWIDWLGGDYVTVVVTLKDNTKIRTTAWLDK